MGSTLGVRVAQLLLQLTLWSSPQGVCDPLLSKRLEGSSETSKEVTFTSPPSQCVMSFPHKTSSVLAGPEIALTKERRSHSLVLRRPIAFASSIWDSPLGNAPSACYEKFKLEDKVTRWGAQVLQLIVLIEITPTASHGSELMP